MAEQKAPTGAFLLLELELDVTPKMVTAIFAFTTRLPGVRAACDLSLVPLELLNERILLRLGPEDQRAWERATQKQKK